MPQLIIRTATPEDVMDLFRWRNDPHVRAMSRQSDLIDVASHCQWYKRVLTSSDKLLLIGILAEQSIGMVRFDRDQQSMWEISIMLAPESRGQGISRVFLEKAICFFYTIHHGASLLAVIKKCNIASLRLFKSLNFKKTIEHFEFIDLILDPAR